MSVTQVTTAPASVLLLLLLAAAASAQEPVRCAPTGFVARGAITDLAWSPDGALLVGADAGRRLYGWDAATGAERFSVTLTDVGMGLTFAPDGQLVTWQSRSVDLRDPTTGQVARTLATYTPRGAIDPETPAQVLFLPGGDEVVIATWRALRVHGLADGAVRRLLWELPADRRAEMREVLLSRDGKAVLAQTARDGTVLVDVATGEVRRTLPGGTFALALSPDGARAVVGATVHDIAGGEVGTLPVVDDGTPVWARWSPDGARLLSAWTQGLDVDGSRIRAHDAARKVVAEVTVPGSLRHARVALSPDGARLAVGAGSGVLLLDASTLTVVGGTRGHLGDLQVAFTRDGKLLAGGAEGTVRRWDPTKGVEEALVLELGETVRSLTVDPTGTWLAAGGLGRVLLAPLAGGAARTLEKASAGRAGELAFDADGAQLAVDDDVWRVADAVKLVDGRSVPEPPLALSHGALVGPRGVVDLASGAQLRGRPGGKEDKVLAVDARRALVLADRGLRLVDLVRSQTVWTVELPDDPPPAAWRAMGGSARFEPSCGALLGGRVAVGRRGRVQVRDAAKGELLLDVTTDDVLESLAFSADGGRLAAGTSAGSALVWTLPAAGPPPARPRAKAPRLDRLKGAARVVWPGDHVLVDYDFKAPAELEDFELRGAAGSVDHGDLTLPAGAVLRHRLEVEAPVRLEVELSRDELPDGAAFAITLGDDVALLWGDVLADARTLRPAKDAAPSRLQGERFPRLTITFDGQEVVVTSWLNDVLATHRLPNEVAGPLRVGLAVRGLELRVGKLRVVGAAP